MLAVPVAWSGGLAGIVVSPEALGQDRGLGKEVGSNGASMALKPHAPPNAGEHGTANPEAALCRPKFGHGATGHGHGERLAGFDPVQDVTNLVSQLLLGNAIHRKTVVLLLPMCVRTGIRLPPSRHNRASSREADPHAAG